VTPDSYSSFQQEHGNWNSEYSFIHSGWRWVI
jgi:hypothetical protein